ncbi:MAG: TIM barrel protein [Chthoniobacterales bacterium]
MKNYQLTYEKLLAWCIVPFDKGKRAPKARAEMLNRLRIKSYVYDWRAEHIPEFEEEIQQMLAHDIEIFGWWMPGEINDTLRTMLRLFSQYQIKPQLWITYCEDPLEGTPQQDIVADYYERLRPLVEAASDAGLELGLYNHMHWFGEPENELELMHKFHADGHRNVGLVYNFHHAHAHIDRFSEVMEMIKPHLMCLNLNGMDRRGMDWAYKIVPLGYGECELDMMRVVSRSGYTGPLGLLNHTSEDSEERLADNLEGFHWCQKILAGEDPGAKPTPRSWQPVSS